MNESDEVFNEILYGKVPNIEFPVFISNVFESSRSDCERFPMEDVCQPHEVWVQTTRKPILTIRSKGELVHSGFVRLGSTGHESRRRVIANYGCSCEIQTGHPISVLLNSDTSMRIRDEVDKKVDLERIENRQFDSPSISQIDEGSWSFACHGMSPESVAILATLLATPSGDGLLGRVFNKASYIHDAVCIWTHNSIVFVCDKRYAVNKLDFHNKIDSNNSGWHELVRLRATEKLYAEQRNGLIKGACKTTFMWLLSGRSLVELYNLPKRILCTPDRTICDLYEVANRLKLELLEGLDYVH